MLAVLLDRVGFVAKENIQQDRDDNAADHQPGGRLGGVGCHHGSDHQRADDKTDITGGHPKADAFANVLAGI